MTFGSVCSGIEAASVAWHPLGWRAAWLSEIAAFPSAVLQHHYPDVPNLGDMTAIDVNEQTADIDVLIGGTPCQAFSVAGLRKSLDDERGNLSLAFCRLARRIAEFGRLKFVVWENVPGVLSTKDNAFGCFLAGLVGESLPLSPAGPKWTHAGCVYGPEGSAAWRILDAQYFGLAQRRKRVFVVFCPGGWADPAKILFEWEGVRRDSPPSREAGERTAASLTRGADSSGRGGYAGRRREDDSNIVAALTGSGRGTARAGESREQDPLIVTHTHTQELSHCLNAGGMGRQDYETETLIPVTGGGFDDVSHALRAEGFDASEDGTGRGTPLVPIAYQCHGTNVGEMGTLRGGNGNETGGVPFIFQTRCSRNGRGMPSDIAPALTSCEGGTHADTKPHVATQFGVRRLTPRECERLQGFPDGYTLIEYRGKPAADGPRHQALGNSMAVPCIRWIGRRIVEARNLT